MSKKSSKANRQRAVIVNARNRKSLSLEYIEEIAKDAKRTQAKQALIVVGNGTEVTRDVQEFAERSHVLIERVPDAEPSPN